MKKISLMKNIVTNNSNIDSDIKDVLEQNHKLKEQIKLLQTENEETKEASAATVKELEDKINLTEQGKSQEIIQVKATLDALENSRE